MTNFEHGTFVKPTEGAEQYILADEKMQLGVVIVEPDEEGLMVIAPVVHDFMSTDIALAVLLGHTPPPFIGMFVTVHAENMRAATAEEVSEHQAEVEDFIDNNPVMKLEVGKKIVMENVMGVGSLTEGKAYEVFHDDEWSYHIIDDDGDKVNAVFRFFPYQIAKEAN